MIKNKKVLISAYSCEPGFSSEREIGWKWSNLISEFAEVYVLTRKSNKITIEKYIEENQIPCNLQFIYYDLPNWLKKWKKAERGLYLYYTLWQFGALLKAREIHKKQNFDIVHYVTFGSLLLPNFMCFMPTKFVLGPVGGAENVPLNFINEFSTKGKISEVIRHSIQKLQRINPLFWIQCIKADKILVRTKETKKMIPNIFSSKTELMLETGVPEELMSYKSININDRTSEITFITIGRFIHSKINLLTLKVILEFKRKYKKPFKFYIVGDGYERKKLENFCLENDLKDNVIFTGWIERNQVFEYLSKSDIYYSTTFKEGGTWAFFEAVAIGLPVVCLKISGPDMIVGDNCGMKIDPSNPEKVIEDLSNALLELSNNSEKRKELSNKAKDYLMGNLTWSQMMNRIETIYDDILKK